MIVDTHTHLYDPTRPQGIPWPNKDNEQLYRTVLPEHFKQTAGPSGVTHTVVVEASVWVDDNDWILDLAKDEPAIVGFVGTSTRKSPTTSARWTDFRRTRSSAVSACDVKNSSAPAWPTLSTPSRLLVTVTSKWTSWPTRQTLLP